uniref:Uncharacterized protein n=1 Tax=Setaria digitata TaxID=48799 RepID=A0A915Q6V8_9BILA
MLELDFMEWCPIVAKHVMNERVVKRRRLKLVDRVAEAQHYFILEALPTVQAALQCMREDEEPSPSNLPP